MQGPKPIATKLRENLAYLRSVGASQSEIDNEIARAKDALDRVSASERKLSGGEKVAAVGSKLASGATFGFFDELSGNRDVQRFLQKQLEEENPKTAIAAEIAGGLAIPGSFFKAPGKLAVNATRAARVGRAAKAAGAVLGEGAVQGGLSAIGSQEGTLEDRVSSGQTAWGAGLGAGTAGAISGVARGVGAMRRSAARKAGVHTPTLDELIGNLPEDEIVAARQRLGESKARNLDDELKLADALPSGEGTLRAMGTANKSTAKMIDADLRQRSNRLANQADERRSLHTGTQRQSDEKTLDGLIEEARRKGEPHYTQGRQEAAAFEAANPRPVRDPMSESMGESGSRMVDLDAPPARAGNPRASLEDAVDLPYVRQEIRRLKADPREAFKGVPDDDHNLLARVYQNLGADIRDPKISRADQRDFIQQREKLRRAMGERAPAWLEGNKEFAGEMALKDAYELGGRDAPADVIPSEMADLSASEQRLYKEAKAQQGRANVSNADLGEFARFSDVIAPIGSRDKAEVFKATFGEDAYREYLADLLEMAKMQRMKAGGGESTTANKLIEQLQMSDNPDIVTLALQMSGGSVGAVARAWPVRALRSIGPDWLMSSQSNADAGAKFLLGPADEMTLDDLVRRQSLAREPRHPALLKNSGFGRDWLPTADLVKNAAAREAGTVVGRRKQSQ